MVRNSNSVGVSSSSPFVELEFVRDEDIHGCTAGRERNKKNNIENGERRWRNKMCGWHVSWEKLRKGISAWWVKEVRNSKWRRGKRGRKLNI